MDPKGIQAGLAYVKVFLEDSALHRGLGRASRRLKRFGANVAGAGRSMLGAAAAVAIPIGAAVRKYVEFDDAIRQVGAVSGATAAQFDRLKASALELGRTTSFTASEVAGLQTELGRAGFSPDEIIEATPHVLALARATGTDLAEAARYAGQTLRQFRMETSETSYVADVLAATANKSNNTLESIAQAMEYAGPVAADFNMSLEETAALVGVLGNVGVQGSNSGTALRRLLTLTGADAARLEEIFGVAFQDAAGDARPLVDVLGEVQQATADLGTAERAAKFKDAFGILGITGASAIAGNVSDARELLEVLQQADGYAGTVAEEMDAGAGGAWRRLTSAVKGAAIALGEALAPTLTAAAGWIGAHVGQLTEWIGKNQELIKKLLKWGAAFAAIGAALVAFGSVISAAGSAVGLFAGALSLMSGNLAAVGFAAAAIGIALIAKETYNASAAVQAYNEQLERRNRLTGEMAIVTSAAQRERLDELQAVDDPEDRAAAVREELEYQQLELAGEERNLRDARKNVESYGSFARLTGNKMLALDEQEVAEREGLLASRKAYVAELTKIAQRAAAQSERAAEDASADPSAVAARAEAAAAKERAGYFGDLEEQAALQAGRQERRPQV